MRTERLRGRAGQEQRKRRLARSSWLCEPCHDKGITRLAVEVDHIIPLIKGGKDIDSNTQNLCSPCHKDKTARDFGHKVRTGGDASGMPNDPEHHWNR